MFGLNPYALAAKAGVVLAILLIGIWIGHKVTSDAWKADQLGIEEAAIAKYKADLALNDQAARKLEVKAGAIDVQYRTIVKTVDRIVEKPVYGNVCLDDDGLRAANSALQRPAETAGKLVGTVP